MHLIHFHLSPATQLQTRVPSTPPSRASRQQDPQTGSRPGTRRRSDRPGIVDTIAEAMLGVRG